MTMSLGVGGLLVHFVPLLTDLGADRGRAAEIASLLGIASVADRIGVGLLLDRFPATLVTVATLLLAASGALLLFMFGLLYAPLAIMLIGLAAGAEVCSRHFGTRSYGAIYGWQYSVFVLGYGLSPFVIGLMKDRLGDYDLALLGSVIAICSAGILAPFIGRPPERSQKKAMLQSDQACWRANRRSGLGGHGTASNHASTAFFSLVVPVGRSSGGWRP